MDWCLLAGDCRKRGRACCFKCCGYKKTADIHVCASLGMLDKEDFTKLHEAGMTMVHNNMETSDEFFKTLCTTHTSDDKRKSIRAAKAAGMKVCSGGLIGLGETLSDRIDLAFSLRELDVDSVPINMLNPIPGTYFEHQEPMKEDEFLRTVAIFGLFCRIHLSAWLPEGHFCLIMERRHFEPVQMRLSAVTF